MYTFHYTSDLVDNNWDGELSMVRTGGRHFKLENRSCRMLAEVQHGKASAGLMLGEPRHGNQSSLAEQRRCTTCYVACWPPPDASCLGFCPSPRLQSKDVAGCSSVVASA